MKGKKKYYGVVREYRDEPYKIVEVWAGTVEQAKIKLRMDGYRVGKVFSIVNFHIARMNGRNGKYNEGFMDAVLNYKEVGVG